VPRAVEQAAKKLRDDLDQRASEESAQRIASALKTYPESRARFLESAANVLAAEAALKLSIGPTVETQRQLIAEKQRKLEQFRKMNLGDVLETVEGEVNRLKQDLGQAGEMLDRASEAALKTFEVVRTTVQPALDGSSDANALDAALTPRELALCVCCKESAEAANLPGASDWELPEADADELSKLRPEGGMGAVLSMLAPSSSSVSATSFVRATLTSSKSNSEASGTNGHASRSRTAPQPTSKGRSSGSKGAAAPKSAATGGGTVSLRWSKPKPVAPVVDIAA